MVEDRFFIERDPLRDGPQIGGRELAGDDMRLRPQRDHREIAGSIRVPCACMTLMRTSCGAP